MGGFGVCKVEELVGCMFVCGYMWLLLLVDVVVFCFCVLGGMFRVGVGNLNNVEIN